MRGALRVAFSRELPDRLNDDSHLGMGLRGHFGPILARAEAPVGLYRGCRLLVLMYQRAGKGALGLGRVKVPHSR